VKGRYGRGERWPEPVIVGELDEYPAEAVLRTLGPELIKRHAHLKELAEEFYQSADLTTKLTYR